MQGELRSDVPAEVVILGASNVTKNLGVIVTTLRDAFPHGVRIFIAHGHGRSYGLKTRALIRQLEGHVDSRLWTTLAEHGDRRANRYALVTDVGNDLLFGPNVDAILGWVTQCLSRLKAAGCEISLATLPVEPLLQLSRWRYQATSRLFFPKHAVGWEDMQSNIKELDAGLRVASQAVQARVVKPSADWYGFDPIHFRMRNRLEAVTALLNGWSTAPEMTAKSGGPTEALRLWTSRPARKWISGKLIETPQPIRREQDHELWLF